MKLTRARRSPGSRRGRRTAASAAALMSAPVPGAGIGRPVRFPDRRGSSPMSGSRQQVQQPHRPCPLRSRRGQRCSSLSIRSMKYRCRLQVFAVCSSRGLRLASYPGHDRWSSRGIDLVRTAARAAESSCYGDATLIAARNWRGALARRQLCVEQAGDQETGILTLSCRSCPKCAK